MNLFLIFSSSVQFDMSILAEKGSWDISGRALVLSVLELLRTSEGMVVITLDSIRRIWQKTSFLGR